MKSKRLLTELFNEANKLSYEEAKYTTHDLWKMCEQIQKDLEVLEILKKYYKSDGWSNGGVIKFWEMSEEELKKIKEWANNE